MKKVQLKELHPGNEGIEKVAALEGLASLSQHVFLAKFLYLQELYD